MSMFKLVQFFLGNLLPIIKYLKTRAVLKCQMTTVWLSHYIVHRIMDKLNNSFPPYQSQNHNVLDFRTRFTKSIIRSYTCYQYTKLNIPRVQTKLEHSNRAGNSYLIHNILKTNNKQQTCLILWYTMQHLTRFPQSTINFSQVELI